MTRRLLIYNARLYTPDNPGQPGWLLTKDSQICSIGFGRKPILPPHSDVQEMDARGARLLPGFIDLHVHGAMGHELMDASASGLEEMAEYAGVPVVNALSDDFHPCQILADWQTVIEHKGALAGLNVAYVGDGANNMAHSYLLGGATAGMHIRIGAPASHQPRADIVKDAEAIAVTTGGSVLITDDATTALTEADVVFLHEHPGHREQPPTVVGQPQILGAAHVDVADAAPFLRQPDATCREHLAHDVGELFPLLVLLVLVLHGRVGLTADIVNGLEVGLDSRRIEQIGRGSVGQFGECGLQSRHEFELCGALGGSTHPLRPPG